MGGKESGVEVCEQLASPGSVIPAQLVEDTRGGAHGGGGSPPIAVEGQSFNPPILQSVGLAVEDCGNEVYLSRLKSVFVTIMAVAHLMYGIGEQLIG